MYMIRDPRGTNSKLDPMFKFSFHDKKSWSAHYKSQVPFGIDPLDIVYFYETGVFFVESSDFNKCFNGFSQARYKGHEGYSSSWYDVDDDEVPLLSSTGPER